MRLEIGYNVKSIMNYKKRDITLWILTYFRWFAFWTCRQHNTILMIFILDTNMLVSKYRNILHWFCAWLRLSCVGVAFVLRWGDQVYYTLRWGCVLGT